MRKLLLLLLFALPAVAQVPVALSPVPHLQFLSNAGIPLASGCVFTYAAGTTTPATTYRDSTGTTTNTNPIILNAGGFADIWLPNAAFKFTVKSAGGVNCASGGTLWTVDNISGIMGLLNLNNTWTGTNQFNQAITVNLNTNQFIAGTAGNRTTLNFPAPAGNITLNFPSTSQTILGNLSPSMTTPQINGVNVLNSPSTYFNMTNNTIVGTQLNSLTKLATGSPSTVSNVQLTDIGGVIGITIASPGAFGTAEIQSSGLVNCQFDNTGTTAGDYVQISTLVAGNCHDSGISSLYGTTFPTSQIVGRVLSTNANAGLYPIVLFDTETKTPSSFGCVNFTSSTITNNNTTQNLLSCTIPANSLAQGNLMRVVVTGVESTAVAMTVTIGASLGGATQCVSAGAATTIANNQSWEAKIDYAILTAGAGGTFNTNCGYFGSTTSGGYGGDTGVQQVSLPVNTTVANLLQITVTMSVANAGNSTTGQLLKAIIF